MNKHHLNYIPQSGEVSVICSECWEHKELLNNRGYCLDCKKAIREYNTMVNKDRNRRVIGSFHSSRYKVGIEGNVTLRRGTR